MSDNGLVVPEYVHEARRDRDRAEAAQLLAEAERTATESRKLAAEAERAEYEAAEELFKLDREREKRRDELVADRHRYQYLFSGEVNDASSKACMDRLVLWTRQAEEPIEATIVINSPGGGVVAGFALIDLIRDLQTQGHIINTHSIGMCASMGGVLLQAGNQRSIGKHAWLLIHEASFSAAGSFAKVEDQVDWVRAVQGQILDLFAARSKMSRAAIKRNWTRRDWWISATDAEKHGFVDEVR